MSSEVDPFSQVSELGKFSRYLPKALKNQGHDIRLITPRYHHIRDRKHGLREVARLKSLVVNMGGKEYPCSVKSGFIPKTKVQIYFVENDEFFDREGIYEDPETHQCWDDNHLRFAFLNHASLYLMHHLGWYPDIILCNDWQTSLVPYFICKDKAHSKNLNNTRTILQVHNLNQLGLFPKDACVEMGIDPADIESDSPLDIHDQCSFLAGGIYCADQIFLLSPKYDPVIEKPVEARQDIATLLETRKDSLRGIVSGVYPEWNPETDDMIQQTYTSEDFDSGKQLNKDHLVNEYQFTDRNLPLIAIEINLAADICRVLLNDSLSTLSEQPANFLFLDYDRSGEYQHVIDEINAAGDNFRYTPLVNNTVKHQIIAGSDFYLTIASMEEPTMLPLQCLIYGTIPVIEKIGGLDELLTDIKSDPEQGCCLTFNDFSIPALFSVLELGLGLYNDPEQWEDLRLRCLQSDFSWQHAVENIESYFNSALETERQCLKIK